MQIIIVGSGKTGKYVIESALRDHQDVCVIEKNQESAHSTAANYNCTVINADATQLETLKDAGAEKADAVIITTRNDVVNATVILIAKQLGVRRLVSVVNDENFLSVFEHFEIDTVENPSRLMGKYLYQTVQHSEIKTFLD